MRLQSLDDFAQIKAGTLHRSNPGGVLINTFVLIYKPMAHFHGLDAQSHSAILNQKSAAPNTCEAHTSNTFMYIYNMQSRRQQA